ncbi:ret oncogene isoform X2 [Leptinotarsa decemlineata]|uniref:ret oncogene isoform X2 n=1 Tax=Leptinotarsa decemlineata TaxID=7539 RepID=UPI003D3072BC
MGLRGVMLCVLFLSAKVNSVSSVYLTMTDIELKIPNEITTSQMKTYPLIELGARNIYGEYGMQMRYSLNITGEYMQINTLSGEVLLTSKFFREIKGIEKISSTAYVDDISNSGRDKTSLQVNVFPLDELDCDKFVEEICFWTRATYRIERRSGATLMGSLSSPFFLEICPYKINYTLAADPNFNLIPPNEKRNFWSISTVRSLSKIEKDNTSLQLTCILENTQGNEKGDVRKIERNIPVIIMDIDEFPPRPQSAEVDITMNKKTFGNGEVISHPHLIFVDNDTLDANHYDALIVGGDIPNLLKPICKKHPLPQKGYGMQTVIHCGLKFTKDVTFNTSSYIFHLQLNDTTLRNEKINSIANMQIRFVIMDTPQSLTRLKLYPRSIVKVFRTAAPLARVTQPTDIRNCSVFELVEINQTKGKPIFSITPEEGIVFVHDFLQLKKKASEYISLNISWFRQNQREYDELQVRIVEEPNKTCDNMEYFDSWVTCAEYGTPEECLRKNSCGISTGGSPSVELRGPERCMWRGDVISSNITHLYSTCSPDIRTCPDGICDSLEMLHDSICPQDCTTQPVVPLKINKMTGRGVDVASGTVVCSRVNCYSVKSKKGRNNNRKESKDKEKKHSLLTQTHANGSVSHLNFNFTHENITAGKFSLDIGKCGTMCIMGVGVGTLFLAGSIAFIVICYKLDRTNKAVRKKIEEDNQEMTAPLSISGPGNVHNDPLAFSFNITTPMNDTTFINNIINKFTPDPKWEFPRSQLVIMQTLGEGEFGRVLKAKALNIAGQTGHTTVAVKTLKDDARESELNDLLSEYQLLKEVSHPNVIRLLGVCTEPEGPVYLIIEYAEHGSLRNYLRRSRKLQQDFINDKSPLAPKENDEFNYDEPKTSDITPNTLLSFAWQISNGMAYLSDIKLVHRDLAARNVLLAADKVCKISDFGLTRDVYEDNAYLKRSKGRVPVKWMAPESLADHIYTTKSDVWSFGVLVWELVTLGATPYPGIAVQNLYHLLRQGYRMERPNNCSPALYKIMRHCWQIDPEKRPTFQELSKCWERLLEDKMEYINLSNNAIHNRGYFLSPFEEENSPKESPTSDISPLNYLSRTQSYEKCGSIEKALEAELQKITNTQNTTQGYETPVKVPRKVKTPSNENPEEYTDMCGKS